MWRCTHTALVILSSVLTASAQFSEVWTNGDYFATHVMASECYSGSVERCEAVGVTPDAPSWWDYLVGKNRAKAESVKANIKAVRPYFIKPTVSNILETIQSEGVGGLTWSNDIHFLSDIGLPTNALDETPYFKLQYPGTTGGWVNIQAMLTNLVRTKRDMTYWPKTNITSDADFDTVVDSGAIGWSSFISRTNTAMLDKIASNYIPNCVGSLTFPPSLIDGVPLYVLSQNAKCVSLNIWTNSPVHWSYAVDLASVREGVSNHIAGLAFDELPKHHVYNYDVLDSQILYDPKGAGFVGFMEQKITRMFNEHTWWSEGDWSITLANDVFPQNGAMNTFEPPHMMTGNSRWECKHFETNYIPDYGSTNFFVTNGTTNEVSFSISTDDLPIDHYVTNAVSTNGYITNISVQAVSAEPMVSFANNADFGAGLYYPRTTYIIDGHNWVDVTNRHFSLTTNITLNISNEVSWVSNSYVSITNNITEYTPYSISITNVPDGTNFVLIPKYSPPNKASKSMLWNYELIRDLPTNINKTVDSFAYVDLYPVTNDVAYWYGDFGEGYTDTSGSTFDDFGMGYTNGWYVSNSGVTNSDKYYFGRLWGTNDLAYINDETACPWPSVPLSTSDSEVRGWIVSTNIATIWWDFKYK